MFASNHSLNCSLSCWCIKRPTKSTAASVPQVNAKEAGAGLRQQSSEIDFDWISLTPGSLPPAYCRNSASLRNTASRTNWNISGVRGQPKAASRRSNCSLGQVPFKSANSSRPLRSIQVAFHLPARLRLRACPHERSVRLEIHSLQMGKRRGSLFKTLCKRRRQSLVRSVQRPNAARRQFDFAAFRYFRRADMHRRVKGKHGEHLSLLKWNPPTTSGIFRCR